MKRLRGGTTSKGFNPRPPNSGGASEARRQGYPADADGVSILAPRIRGARQAMPQIANAFEKFQSSPPEFGGRVRCARCRCCRDDGFNPRPPNSGGASRRALRHPGGDRVSILAPRIRGARRHVNDPLNSELWFQSSPPEFGGRVAGSARRPSPGPRFNPRPPNSGGASRAPGGWRCREC